MRRLGLTLLLVLLTACGGRSWNTTLAQTPAVRWAMVESVRPGVTTEKAFTARWGNPAQKSREGAETRFIYRDMRNPPDYRPLPQWGDSAEYVVVVFQYGLATDAYSSDTEGCRGTFAPRPPGPGFDNPGTVYPVNCGVVADTRTSTGRSSGPGGGEIHPGVPSDAYPPAKGKL